MMKLKLAALLAASALTFGTGAAMAAPQQDRTPPKAEQRAPRENPMDLNKDGVVSKDEWMKAAAARFEKFDVSKDGKLSREEIRFGRFEEMRKHRHGHGGRGEGRGWRRAPQGGHGFGPGREGPGGPGGPGHRMGPPPPPPADAPAPAAPAGN